MKVAAIVGKFPSLTETFILNQMIRLIDSGLNVKIISELRPESSKKLNNLKDEITNRIHYLDIPKNKFKRFIKCIYLIITKYYRYIFKILQTFNFIKYKSDALSLRLFYFLLKFLDEDFDIIHCHFGNFGILASYIKEIGIKCKIVTSFHGYELSSFIKSYGTQIYDKLFTDGDKFLPINRYWKKKLINLGVSEEKIIVHHMGIDINRFEYVERTPKKDELINILTVGRLTEKKGHFYSIKAIHKLINKYKKIQYQIVGTGPLEKKLKELVSELEISDHVKFYKNLSRDELLKLYNSSHIFLLASITAKNGDKEGIPVVLMEALSMGIPVVSTIHGGIPEIIINKKTGIIVPEKDIIELTKGLEFLIENPENSITLSKEGRKLVEKEFNIQKLVKKLINLYNSIL